MRNPKLDGGGLDLTKWDQVGPSRRFVAYEIDGVLYIVDPTENLRFISYMIAPARTAPDNE